MLTTRKAEGCAHEGLWRGVLGGELTGEARGDIPSEEDTKRAVTRALF